MAILKIARMGHPILRQRAQEVADPADPEIHRLVRDMLETMEDADGAGLAAPQVHVPLRVVIFHVPPDRADSIEADQEPSEDPEGVPLTVLVNPVIEPLSDETALDWEGCLSVPGLMGAVPRHTQIRYRAATLDGGTIDRTAAGFHARVVQHECDHLEGILYPQRMTDLSLLMFRDEMRHGAPESESESDASNGDGCPGPAVTPEERSE